MYERTFYPPSDDPYLYLCRDLDPSFLLRRSFPITPSLLFWFDFRWRRDNLAGSQFPVECKRLKESADVKRKVRSGKAGGVLTVCGSEARMP